MQEPSKQNDETQSSGEASEDVAQRVKFFRDPKYVLPNIVID